MLPARICTFLSALFALLINTFPQNTCKSLLFPGNITSPDSMDHLPYVEMREAKILPYKSYEEFRSALIHHENDLNSELAKKNLNMIMVRNKKSSGPPIDAYSNYTNQMKMKDENNNALIFLSSEPGKGLFGALSAIGIHLFKK